MEAADQIGVLVVACDGQFAFAARGPNVYHYIRVNDCFRDTRFGRVSPNAVSRPGPSTSVSRLGAEILFKLAGHVPEVVRVRRDIALARDVRPFLRIFGVQL